MTDRPNRPTHDLRIQTPCPKTWEQLAGSGAKRFCSECSLHVHDASQLTRVEAERLVAGATSRVCMRMQFDAAGAPLYREAAGRSTFASRMSRWAVSAVAGLRAACHGAEPVDGAGGEDLQPGTSETTTKMGVMIATEKLGDVAVPAPPQPRALLGEVAPEPPPLQSPPPQEQR